MGTNKNKFIGLLVVCVVISFVICWLPISNTVKLYRSVSEVELYDKKCDSLNVLLSFYEKRLEELNISHNLPIGYSFQEQLLLQISSYCKESGTKLIAFNSPHSFKSESNTLETYVFRLSGEFIPLLKFMYSLERGIVNVPVESVFFEKKYNNKLKQNILYMTCFVQNVQTESEIQN